MKEKFYAKYSKTIEEWKDEIKYIVLSINKATIQSIYASC